MKVKFVKLHEDAVEPKKAYSTDVGFDVTAIDMNIVEKEDYGYIEYDTGIAVTPPEGYFVMAVPRSSLSKTGLILANSVGIIDPDYNDSIKLRFKYVSGSKYYGVGDKIGQLIILPLPQVEFEEVELLDDTDRGLGGFGSTGS